MKLLLPAILLPLTLLWAKDYPCWVNNQQFSDDRLVIPCGDGSARYDPAAHVLTLDNACITQACEEQFSYGGILIQEESITIILLGEKTIGDTGGPGIDTYYAECDLTLCGGGSLLIDAFDPDFGYGLLIGEQASTLTVHDATLHIRAAVGGIFCGGEVRLEHAALSVSLPSPEEAEMESCGVTATRQFQARHADVTVSGGHIGIQLGETDGEDTAFRMTGGRLQLEDTAIGVKFAANDDNLLEINGGDCQIDASELAIRFPPEANGGRQIHFGEEPTAFAAGTSSHETVDFTTGDRLPDFRDVRYIHYIRKMMALRLRPGWNLCAAPFTIHAADLGGLEAWGVERKAVVRKSGLLTEGFWIHLPDAVPRELDVPAKGEKPSHGGGIGWKLDSLPFSPPEGNGCAVWQWDGSAYRPFHLEDNNLQQNRRQSEGGWLNQLEIRN